jgi:hypothetical protein
MRSIRNKEDLNRLKSLLRSQDKEVLISILADRACQQQDLADFLFALPGPTSCHSLAALNAVDNAFEEHVSFLYDQDEGHVDFSGLQNDVIQIIRQRHEEADYAAVTSLVKRSLSDLQHYLPAMEDWDTDKLSESLPSFVAELERSRRLAEEHLGTPPAELAQQLFERFTQEIWAACQDEGLELDLEAMGPDGALHLQRLAEQHWQSRMASNGKYYRFSNEMNEMRLLRLMTLTARITGDSAFLQVTYAGDLSRREQFLDVARLYRRLGDDLSAIEWAENGVAAFRGEYCSELNKFLFEQYAKTERHDDAIAILFKRFADAFDLAAYNELKQYALRSNRKAWSQWRDRCYELVLAVIADAQRPPGLVVFDARDRLVQMRISDGAYDMAWTEAKQYGCSERISLELSQRAWRGDPDSAYVCLAKELESAIERKGKRDYEQATSLLGIMKEIAISLQTPERFDVYGVRGSTERKVTLRRKSSPCKHCRGY